MSIKINGVDSLNFIDKIGQTNAALIVKKKSYPPANDVFQDGAHKTAQPFLRDQNCWTFEPLLDISSRDNEQGARWWPDELAKLVPECISKNISIEPQIADALKTMAQERNYLIVNLTEDRG